MSGCQNLFNEQADFIDEWGVFDDGRTYVQPPTVVIEAVGKEVALLLLMVPWGLNSNKKYSWLFLF